MDEMGWGTKVFLVIFIIALIFSTYSVMNNLETEQVIIIIALTSFFGWFFLKILEILNNINANLKILIRVSDEVRSHLSQIDKNFSGFEGDRQKYIHWEITDIKNELNSMKYDLHEIWKKSLF